MPGTILKQRHPLWEYDRCSQKECLKGCAAWPTAHGCCISKESGRNQEADNKSHTYYETKYTDMQRNNLGIGKGTLSVYVQATCLVLQQQVSRRMFALSYLFHFSLPAR